MNFIGERFFAVSQFHLVALKKLCYNFEKGKGRKEERKEDNLRRRKGRSMSMDCVLEFQAKLKH